MRVLTKEIRDGGHVGCVFWVCHYHRPDINKKPLRNLPPTQVIVRSVKDEPPKNKTIYYSSTYLSPIGKTGKPQAKVISLVDNTGYRSYCGNEIHVFTTEGACVKEWNEQVAESVDTIEERIKSSTNEWKSQRDALIGIMRF